MKTKISIILFATGLINGHAQDTWTQKTNFGGGPRAYAVGFTIGSKGYIGTGNRDNTSNHADLWEYDPITNVWTQKADFGGAPRFAAVGFSIGTKGYIGTGCENASGCFAGGGGLSKDFWEYDSITNVWTQKADFGGEGRIWAVGLSIGGKGYFGTGFNTFSGVIEKDFWEYDPAINVWTQKVDFGGGARTNAAGFSIDGEGYIGTGGGVNGNVPDFWEYDPITNVWTQRANFGERQYATGLSIGSKGYIGAGTVTGGADFRKDFYEYDPATDSWTRKADFGGTGRYYAVGFSIDGKGYIGTGYSNFVFRKDFWEYTPDDLPVVMLSTTSLTFGVQLDGTRSAAQSVTLTNTGPLTLNISSIAASANFLAKSNCGSSVPAGGSCTIKVLFNPSAEGVLTGNVTINDDAGDSPQTVALTGIGTGVQLSPLALNFGDQIAGTTSDPLRAKVTNISSEDLHIFGIGLGGTNFGDFAETTTCGSRLAAGESCTVNVTFTPAANGDRHANLLIQDDGGASPQSVPLGGTGVLR